MAGGSNRDEKPLRCAAEPAGRHPPLPGRLWLGAAGSHGRTDRRGTARRIQDRRGRSAQVFVWNNKELSTTVPVRPDGLISTPLVEDMAAAGKTPSELARDLEKALSEYVRNPKVNVIVTSFVGGAQVRVVGQAVNPQALPYRSNMTVLDVMIAVGGLDEFAAGNRAKIVRRAADGSQQEIRVRLADLLNKGDMAANVAMEPGDVLIIPETRF
jgi:polysaccharide export outer membrane protein